MDRENKNYVVIFESDDMIQCRGIYPYHEAIGHLVCMQADSIDCWEDNGYEVIERDDFFKLEGDNGFGWHLTMRHKEPEITIHEHWYILEVEE